MNKFGKIGLITAGALVALVGGGAILYNTVPSLHKVGTNNQANIFVFPEGNNSIYKDKPRKEKFQSGFSKILKEISKSNDSVNIVPIGISYSDDKNCMANINIGESVRLAKIKGRTALMAKDFSTLIGDINNKTNLKVLSDTLADLLDESVINSKAL